jgi:hypothetical protein
MDRCVTRKESIRKRELEQIEAELNSTLKGYTYFITRPPRQSKKKKKETERDLGQRRSEALKG